MTAIGKKLISIPQSPGKAALPKSQTSPASQRKAFGNFPSVKQDLLGDPFSQGLGKVSGSKSPR